jgi:hypothetical protein
MKTKQNKNTKTQIVSVSNAQLRQAEAWWAKLSAEDKHFAHELGVVTLAFKNGLAANALSSSASLMEAFMKFRKGVKPVYDKGSATWPASLPELRGWN